MLAVEQKLAQSWPAPAWQDVTLLVAVSGGADSVALARALWALKTEGAGRIVVAHFNHHLRGEQSLADEQFVVDLCRQLDVECEVGRERVAELALDQGNGVEAAARQARYEFFQGAAARWGARYVVTAHTADDQAETILHRLLRGTGLAGLAGMARARALGPATTLLRPLLSFRRAELVDYLARLGQAYREDTSNQLRRYTRNRLRHELLPLLAKTYNPQVVEALLRLGTLAGQAQKVVDALAVPLVESCIRRAEPDAVAIDCRRLAAEPRYLVREVLVAAWRGQGWPEQAMGFDEWEQLADMVLAGASGPSGPKQMFPGVILARRQGDELALARQAP